MLRFRQMKSLQKLASLNANVTITHMGKNPSTPLRSSVSHSGYSLAMGSSSKPLLVTQP